MKRVFEHPAKVGNGKGYWRSLEEYSETSEFQGWLEKEFPAGADQFWGGDASRRSFLKLMGASMALAGVGLTSCRRPEAHIVPFTETPENMVPGKAVRYATAMPRRKGANSLMVTSYEGRPVKIEGNSAHASIGGGTDAFAQASLLDLYNPYRSQRVLYKGRKSSIEDFDENLNELIQGWEGNGGEGLAFLVDETSSPTRNRLRDEILSRFPNATWTVYEPADNGNQREAFQLAFGSASKPVVDYEKAEVVFSVDCDFLGSDEGGVSASYGFSKARRVEDPKDKMNRLYAVEHRFTPTGGMADHRLRLPASSMAGFVLELGKELARQGLSSPALNSALGNASAGRLEGVKDGWLKAAAKDLIAHGGKSAVVIGSQLPVEVQLLGVAINEALGNFNKTIRLVALDSFEGLSIESLGKTIKSGGVRQLIVLGGNPVYNAPSEYDWETLFQKVEQTIYLGYHESETTEASLWHLPLAHYLESWGDACGEDGGCLSIQPLILPLYDGLSQIELLAKILKSEKNGLTLVQETFAIKQGIGVDSLAFSKAWRGFVHDGFSGESPNLVSSDAINAVAIAENVTKGKFKARSLSKNSLEVVLTASYAMDDGRYIDNGWLQELADPITKLTWDNAAVMSPKTAEELGLFSRMTGNEKGIQTSDMITVTVNGEEIEAPVLVSPGHADYSVTLTLGYGQKNAGKVGEGSGYNAYPVKTSETSYILSGAKISKIGERKKLAVTQQHHSMEGRAIVREAPLEEFRKNPEFAQQVGVESHMDKSIMKSFYDVPEFTGEHQWAMAIDLTTCTGCNACVVACQSENNIPIVGREQVMDGREMHWLRIDRYYSGEDAENPEMLTQPMACVHCENAPCETVCPVNATVHSEDGLNVMVYNRCIGTRYCANNCPYKVRRFNFFDYNQRELDKLKNPPFSELWGSPSPKGSPEVVKMSRNPNVTVRMRGVMEKCTYCLQRIQESKISTKIEARDSNKTKIPTDQVQTACQQACPTESIIFGDKSDPKSSVAHKRMLPLNYSVLGYLNVKPRTTYLARIINPNLEIPGAEALGQESIKQIHHDDHGGHGNHSKGHSKNGHDDKHQAGGTH